MKEIIIKYAGNCKKCNAFLDVGQPAMYEKSMGIFCKGCEPTDIEEIRHFRQLKADIKADKYDEWASKREQKANQQLNSYPEIRHDIAFNTQPGHIPFRERMNNADDRAYKSLRIAEKFRDKAENLRKVRVKGDAAKRTQAERDKNDEWVKVGMKVHSWIVGECEIVKINKKTYTVKSGKTGNTFTEDKSFIHKIAE